jgi:uracil phosphoribosyltransferase
MLSILPSARVGHIGIYRDPRTHSAIAAVDRVKETSPLSIKFVCLLASRVGVEAFHEHHPDVPIYTAAVDERLNEKGYILPGLGDAGDRLFGTR